MNSDLIESIKELANSPSVRISKVARVRELLPDIEHAQHAGVQLIDICKFLNAHGFEEMNLKCLQNLLYQARKWKGKDKCTPKHKATATLLQTKPIPMPTNAIDADSILEDARKSMKITNASSITLGLLRSPKSTPNERNTK